MTNDSTVNVSSQITNTKMQLTLILQTHIAHTHVLSSVNIPSSLSFVDSLNVLTKQSLCTAGATTRLLPSISFSCSSAKVWTPLSRASHLLDSFLPLLHYYHSCEDERHFLLPLDFDVVAILMSWWDALWGTHTERNNEEENCFLLSDFSDDVFHVHQAVCQWP